MQDQPSGRALGPRAHVVDMVSVPGSAERANEDCCGHAGCFAWVIDGATGLADTPLTEGPSDAAWLAIAASEAFAAIAATGETDPKRLMVRAAEIVAARFEREKLRAPSARYEIPTAAVLLAAFEPDRIRIAELGDTRLYLLSGGTVRDVGGLEVGRDLERQNAARLVRPGAHLRTPDVLEHLRRVRNLANTEDGYWVFAADPEPARRARTHEVPLGPGAASALLLTDGLDALAADYGKVDPAGLVVAALDRGLAAVAEDVRRVEREEDPDCRLYPRFKPSDDATGLLVGIAPRR